MHNHKTALMTLLAGMTAGSLYASSSLTNFTTGDVLLCFRGATSDMVVDAGPVSTFLGYGHNTTNAVGSYTASQFNGIGGLDGINGWQAFAWKSDNTIFMASPRNVDPNTPGAVWSNQSAASQSIIAGRMAAIVSGAAYSYTAKYDTNNSTPTCVIEKDDSSHYKSGYSYHYGYTGNFGDFWNGNFQGESENSTLPANFSTSGTVSHVDFYQLNPNAGGTATQVGYFELNTNGAINYVAYPASATAPSVPTIVSISRTGNQTTIQYTTGLNGTYSLKGSSDLTVPVGSWGTLSTLSTGDTATHSVQITDTATNDFYIIQGQ